MTNHHQPLIQELSTAINNRTPSAKWAVQSLDCQDNGLRVAQAIRDGKAVTVSDGSLKLCFGTSAFIIAGEDDTHPIRAVNVVPGPIKKGDSHRCKLAGLYGTMVTLETLCTVHNITQGSITIGCDNQRASRLSWTTSRRIPSVPISTWYQP